MPADCTAPASQAIATPAAAFSVATEQTDHIPNHAITVSGPLIEIGKTNLNGWGITESAVEGILAGGVGLPIRVCNSPDPHLCDIAHDNYSDVGYTIRMWQDDGWIHASAAITKHEAADRIADGTWMPFSNGSWSVTGNPVEIASDFDETGLFDSLAPASIAIFTPPAKPAFTGSNFKMVAAAIETNSHITIIKDETPGEQGDDPAETPDTPIITEVTMEGTVIETDVPGEQVPAEPPAVVDVQTPEVTTPPAEVPAEPAPDTKETMFSKEDLDAQVAEALERQKTEYDDKIAKMTPTSDLDPMFAAVKADTIDAIKREKLVNTYIDMLTASSVLSAPYRDGDDVLDDKIAVKRAAMMDMPTASVEQAITETELMVAALPAAKSAFEANAVAAHIEQRSTGFTVGDCKGGD